MDVPGTKYDTTRSTCAQVLATLAFNCLMVHVGIIIAMPVLVIGALRLENSALAFTEQQAAWFGGLIFVIQPLGSLVSGFLQDLLGRKTCMMMVNIPQLAAWVIMYYASSTSLLFAAVALLGLSIGFMEAPVLSYIGEISEPRLRGVLSTFGGIFFNVGLMVEAFIGAFRDWRSMVLINMVAPVVTFIALALVPDSPAWLVTKGRVEDAQKAYQWLRGWVSPKEVQEELDALVAYVKQTRNPIVVNGAEYKAVSKKKGGSNGLSGQSLPESKLKIFLHPSVQRPLRLIVVYFFIAACSSLTALRPFFIEILDSLQLPVRPHLVMVFGSTVTLLGALSSTLTLHRVGKRGLSFLSLGLSIFSCMGLGLYLYLGVKIPWIPLLLFIVSFYSAPLGIIFVPWILISELFPLKGRGMAGGVAAALGYLIMFFIIITYINIVSLVQMSGACFLYGTVGLLGFVYLYYQLPETEGIPLEVIERLYADNNVKTDERSTEEEVRLTEVEGSKVDTV